MYTRLQTLVVVESSETGKTYEIPYLAKFTCAKSYNNIEQTGRLVMPNKLYYNLGIKSSDVFSRGSKVSVYAGYYPEQYKLFDGYVKTNNIGLITTCDLENYTYEAKKINVEDNIFYDVKLKTLLNYVYKNNETTGMGERINPSMGDFKIENNPTVIDVLNAIKAVYGLRMWFDGSKLYCGLPPVNDTKHVFKVNYNVPTEWNELEYIDEKNIPVIVCGKLDDDNDDDVDVKLYYSYNNKTKKPGFTTNRPAGQLHNVSLTGCTEADLRFFMKRIYDNVSFNGFAGSFTCKGAELVSVGDKINFTDANTGVDGIDALCCSVRYDVSVEDDFNQTVQLSYKL